jgi:hypothetical protein
MTLARALQIAVVLAWVGPTLILAMLALIVLGMAREVSRVRSLLASAKGGEIDVS